MTISDDELIRIWLSQKSQVTQLNYAPVVEEYQTFLGKPLAEATLVDIRKFLDRFEDYKPATFNCKRAALKSLYALGLASGVLPHNHFELIPKKPSAGTRAHRVPSTDDLEKLFLQELPTDWRLVCGLLYALGLRAKELRFLKLENIEPVADGYMITVVGKRDAERTVHLPSTHGWLVDLLQEKISSRLGSGASPGSTLFVTRFDKPPSHSRIAYMVSEAGKRAGLSKKLCPHLLRHAHATHALDAGAPPHVVQKTLGHLCMSTVTRYAHPPADATSTGFIVVPS